MGKLRPKEEEGLFWSHTVTKCALTTPRPFLANSTNKNSNNFNLLEVDDVSMSVPNLSFSAPNDKEKTRESFSQGFFVKMSLSSKFRKWEFLSWAWNCTHTHTHTHTLNSVLLGSLQMTHLPSGEKPTWGQRPSSLPQHQGEYSSSATFLHLNFIFPFQPPRLL